MPPMLLLEPPYRQVLIMVVSGLAVTFLAFLGYRARPGKQGWRRIEPSPMHWFGLLLGGGLVLLFLYVRLFVGSSRADAESQMRILTGLIVAFGLGVVICGHTVLRIRRMAFEWRGGAFAWSTHGQRIARTADELTRVHRSALGWVVLTFADGATLKLDENARGSLELVNAIAERRPDLLPADEED